MKTLKQRKAFDKYQKAQNKYYIALAINKRNEKKLLDKVKELRKNLK